MKVGDLVRLKKNHEEMGLKGDIGIVTEWILPKSVEASDNFSLFILGKCSVMFSKAETPITHYVSINLVDTYFELISESN